MRSDDVRRLARDEVKKVIGDGDLERKIRRVSQQEFELVERRIEERLTEKIQAEVTAKLLATSLSVAAEKGVDHGSIYKAIQILLKHLET